jgi:hypothetical protein
MPSSGKDTGHGGTVAFSGDIDAFVVPFRKIGAVEQEIEKVESSDLSNSECKSYLPGDVAEPGEFEVEYAFDTAADLPECLVPGTITITLPKGVGGTSAGNLAGSGFIRKRSAMPEFATNGLQIGKLTAKFDGKTGPTLTKAVG